MKNRLGQFGPRCALLVLFVGSALHAGQPAVNAADIKFRKYQLDPVFWSEGVAIGDIDQDGDQDVFAGDVWYETKEIGVWERHQLRKPRGVYDGTKGYSNSFANFSQDVNGDGWVDLIVVGFPGEPFHWYENPRGGEGLWKERMIWRSACNETPIFADLLEDGKPGVLLGYQPEAQIGFFQAPENAEDVGLWEPLAVSTTGSPGTVRFWHGLGCGDVDGDGRNDVIINTGWWRQPEKVTGEPWEFQELVLDPPKRQPPDPAREDRSCADIHAYDVDGDGDQDIISSAAHKYGVWWFERIEEGDDVRYEPHVIVDDVSQSHALHLIDIDGDGLKDLVTGKRWYAHQGKDPGGTEPALLYWLELQRTDDGPKWVRRMIDSDSGHGTQFVVADFDGDALLDVVTSNKRGVHVFLQQRP